MTQIVQCDAVDFTHDNTNSGSYRVCIYMCVSFVSDTHFMEFVFTRISMRSGQRTLATFWLWILFPETFIHFFLFCLFSYHGNALPWNTTAEGNTTGQRDSTVFLLAAAFSLHAKLSQDLNDSLTNSWYRRLVIEAWNVVERNLCCSFLEI